MPDERRWDWTAEDYKHEAELMQILRAEGFAAYCAVLDAENEAWMFRVRGGEFN
jgi:hypothetical protein